MNILDDVVGE